MTILDEQDDIIDIISTDENAVKLDKEWASSIIMMHNKKCQHDYKNHKTDHFGIPLHEGDWCYKIAGVAGGGASIEVCRIVGFTPKRVKIFIESWGGEMNEVYVESYNLVLTNINNIQNQIKLRS